MHHYQRMAMIDPAYSSKADTCKCNVDHIMEMTEQIETICGL